jgi:hypothetical protein
MKTMLLLGGLLVLNALQTDKDKDAPKEEPVSAKLVAKKSTYKLDLKGSTLAEYKKAVENGTAPVVPVELFLVITNNTRNDIRVRTKGKTLKMTLSIKGDGIIEGTPPKVPAMDVKARALVLRPGGRVAIPIDSLRDTHGTSTTRIHAWTEPGEYTVTASFYTVVIEDWKGTLPKKLPYKTFTPPPIKLKVEK